MQTAYEQLPKVAKIQMIAMYIAMIPLLAGMFLIDLFPPAPWIGIALCCLIVGTGFIYPYLEETRIIREANNLLAGVFTLISNTSEEPVKIQLLIENYALLEDWIEAQAEITKEEQLKVKLIDENNEIEHEETGALSKLFQKHGLPDSSEQLLEFVERPIKDAAMQYLQKLKGQKDKFYTYMLFVRDLYVLDREINHVIVNLPKPLQNCMTFADWVDIEEYDIPFRAINGVVVVEDIIDDLLVLTVDYLLENSLHKQRVVEIERTESFLDRVKDKTIQALLSWKLRDTAKIREETAKSKLFKDNFESLVQELERFQLYEGSGFPKAPWYAWAGWIVAVILLMLLMMFMPVETAQVAAETTEEVLRFI